MKLYYSIAHPSEIIGEVRLGYIHGPYDQNWFKSISSKGPIRTADDFGKGKIASTYFVVEYDEDFNPVEITKL
jgi:hypothetical protein